MAKKAAEQRAKTGVMRSPGRPIKEGTGICECKLVEQLCNPQHRVYNCGSKAVAEVKTFVRWIERNIGSLMLCVSLRTWFRNYTHRKCSNPTDPNLVAWMHLHTREAGKCSLALSYYVPRCNLEDPNTKMKKGRWVPRGTIRFSDCFLLSTLLISAPLKQEEFWWGKMNKRQRGNSETWRSRKGKCRWNAGAEGASRGCSMA